MPFPASLAVLSLTLGCACVCSCVGMRISYCVLSKFKGGAMVVMVL